MTIRQTLTVERASALPSENEDWLRQLAESSMADATKASYRAALKRWAAFAGPLAFPPDEDALLSRIRTMDEAGESMAATRQLLAALAKACEVAGQGEVPKSARKACAFIEHRRRRAGAQSRQSRGVRADDVGGIVFAARVPRPSGRGGKGLEREATASRRAFLDEAIVRVMRDGLLRVSECAALTWQAIERQPDGSATVPVFRRKTGTPTVAYLSRRTMDALDAARREGDPRLIPLSPRQIARRFKAACQAAGIEGATSHGARVGMAQDLAADGAALPELMQAGGWKRAEQVAHYVRRQSAARGAVARFYSGRE